jgi:poly(3-hydroxybutyrate) depolymerase
MRFVKKLFGGHKAPAARGRKSTTVRLAVEGLEERSLMAAGLGLGLSSASALGAVSQPVLSRTAAVVNQAAPDGPLAVANPIDYQTDVKFKLPYQDGNYWIIVPSSYNPQTPTELFVWSHGCYGTSEYEIDNYKARDGGPSYITIAIDGHEYNPDIPDDACCWNMDTDPQRVLDAIADVKTHFNIDPRRVVLGGYSSGGDLSYRIAFEHSTEIAGVLAENTSPFRDTGLDPAVALAAPVHFHIAHLAHTRDETYAIAGVESEIAAVRAAGQPADNWASLDLIEKDGTHYDGNTIPDFQNELLPHLGDGWLSPAIV